MKTTKIFMSVTLLAILFSFTPERNNVKVRCPLVQLASPPSTLKVGTPRVCQNTLTVNTNICNPYTFHFTWSGGFVDYTTAAGSSVLNFNLPAMTSGTTIYLVIDDNGGNSSITYTFTATTSC